MSERGSDEALERAWDALEEDDAERALELAAGLPDGELDTWVLRATALLDLGRALEAARAVERATALGGGRDPGALWVRAELALLRWEFEAAARDYQSVLEVQSDPAALERLALVRDLQGDFAASDALLARAFELEPELHPLPRRLSAEELDAALGEAVSALPEPFRRVLEEVPVLVEPVPRSELGLAEGDALPPDLLGLFVGASMLERSDEQPLDQVARIYLFQRNLERASASREELVEELRVTLYHELGHLLGFDEDGVDELGLA